MTDYYVDNQNGSNGNTGLSTGQAWGTLAYADDQVSGGDTLYIMEGTGVYNEQLAPGSGSVGNYITFEAYSTDTPRIHVAQGTCVQLQDRDYIKLVGLTIGATVQSVTAPLFGVNLHGATYIEITDCIIAYGRSDTYSRGIKDDYGEGSGVDYLTVDGCTIHHWGHPEPNDQGEGIKIHDHADYILIENNTLYSCGHVPLAVFGDHAVIRNNEVYNTDMNKCAAFWGYTDHRMVIDNNNFHEADEYEGTYPNGIIQMGTQQGIFRNNKVWSGIGTGLELYHQTNYYSTDARVYNNTTYNNGTGSGTTNTGYGSHLEQSLATPDCTGIVWKNNIFYNNHRDGVGYRNLAQAGDHTESNNWETADGNPNFTDAANGNFILASNSPCINNGGWLTTTNGSGSESTTLVVQDSYYFTDGYGLVTGDTIQLEGQTTTAIITNINYATHTITIDTALTWIQGTGVALPYLSTAPDQGAIEYTSGNVNVSVAVAPLALAISLPAIAINAIGADEWRDAWTASLGEYFGTAADYNARNIVAAGSISYAGTQKGTSNLRVSFEGHNTGTSQIDGASIGLSDTGGSEQDYEAAPTRITFDGGASVKAIGIGETVVSDIITFALDQADDYCVHVFWDTGGHAGMALTSSGSDGDYRYYDLSSDDTLTEDISGYTAEAGYTRGLTKIEVLVGSDVVNAAVSLPVLSLTASLPEILVTGENMATNQEDFPHIYIDGSSGGVGSEADPYTNLSDVNWTTGGDNSIFDYLAGTPTESPTIHLAKAATWRETMTVGASGTATYPIVVNSYGSGADPIIKGSDLVGTWTASEATETWGENTGDDYTGITGDTFIYEGEATTNYDESVEQLRTKYNTAGYQREAVVSFDLSAIAGETVTNADLYLHIFTSPIINLDVRLYSCVDAFVEGTATWNTYDGSNAWTGTRGRGVLLDTQSLTNGQTGWVTFSSATLDTYINTQAGSTAYFILDVTNVINDRGVAFEMSESGDATERPYLSITYGTANVWQAACTTEPEIVFLDDTKGTNVASIALCNGANEWYWASNVLYVYSTSDPDTAYTSPGIEAGKRTMNVTDNSKAYITLDGLCITHANGTGVEGAIDNRHSAASNWIVQNCDITYNSNLGILISNTSGFTVDGNTIDYNGGGGLSYHDSQTSGTVSNNTITYNETGIGIRGTGGVFNNNTIHHNNLNGFYIHSTASGNTIKFNNTYTNGQAATFAANTQKLEIYSYGGDDNTFYYNLIHDGSTTNSTGSTGIYLDHGSENNNIYNNVIYNFPDIAPGTQGHGIVLEDGTLDTQNNTIKNNIISDCGSQVTFADDIGENNLQGNVFDNNCYYVGAGDSVAYADGAKTLAQWQAMTGSPDPNSIDDDPLMTDPANGDFTLQTTSPCINAGVDVSLTVDYSGEAVAPPPDIGAYETDIGSMGGGIGMTMHMGMGMGNED